MMEGENMPTTAEKRFEILMVGTTGVGKTSLAVRYKDGEFNPDLKCTLLVDSIRTNINICGEDIKLRILDTTGQSEKFQFELSTYYANAQGIIFVYDITSQDSLKALDSLFLQFNDHISQDVKKIVVGNKIDKEPRRVSAKEGKELSKKYGAAFMETSAKENDNIKIAFEYLAQQLFLSSETWLVNKYKTLCMMENRVLPVFNILLLGSSGVGKTCFIECYEKGDLKKKATVAMEYHRKSFEIGDGPAEFNFLDTQGQERFYAIPPQFFRKAYGAVILYDVTNLDSFQNLEFWFQQLDQNCEKEVKKILVGNKTDLKPRSVSVKTAKEFACEKNIAYIETSTVDNNNIDIAIEYVAQEILLCPDLWKVLDKSGMKLKDTDSKPVRWWQCWRWFEKKESD